MKTRQRSLWILVLLAFGFTVVSHRLVELQLVEHSKYARLAMLNHCARIELPAHRGMIVDVHGTPLAQSQAVYEVRLDGKNLRDPEQTVPKLESLLGLAPGSISANFRPTERYRLLAKRVGEDVVQRLNNFEQEKLRQWRVGGRSPEPFLLFREDFIRVYPNGREGAAVVGMLDAEGKGVAGVERAFDRQLRGLPGERWIEKDVLGREIPVYRGFNVAPVDGATVRLTLDLTIQHILEKGLDDLDREFRPKAICSVVMRPSTGEVLGMAVRPTFDPNDGEHVRPELLRNRCLTDPMEPGSIFKIITLAGVLEERQVTLNSLVNCENGAFSYAGYVLHDSHAHGTLTVREATSKSSNIGFAKLGIGLGSARLYRFARAFGIGAPTGLLPSQGESAGVLRPPWQWSKLSISRIPMGQEVMVTPMQMTQAMSVIANGGWFMKPLLVRGWVSSDGRPISYVVPEQVRRVISEKTARWVSLALASVVAKGGTGTKAAVPGFTVAGKTGTAQKAVGGSYGHGRYISSFVGYLPEEDPQFVLLIMVDEPKGGRYYGGDVAAPAFSSMASQIAEALGIVPRSAPARAANVGPL
ncbi:cell division protein FtsI (penicillin-binding protein 3) [Methylacidimicrobium cyclopophantes]|uniref:Cell division protein FtsI (Penicillin-binding protein 3) n=1 Tax=Methylacidimicrobium cyclopophantes TaxID=1041766 RepID=A0A5E6M9X7_9BACT|nr:penicillin-binding protein 2 [Methylacidimicrobium cyclopophantes]VVM05769.1 cell division protein FtsI (penicillin-binding protein 3) [Methylacidimicrobium cyclopophantes]